jgi:hypothetical protein
MADTRITVNGQHYDSPDAMPPDVRRLYDEAMRTVAPSLASGQGGANMQVITGHLGEHFGASIVVNRTITVNNRTFKNADALPPEARQATGPRPIEPSSTVDTLRGLPVTLAVIVVIALILWALLDH